MVVGRLGLGGGLLIACGLAGCGARALAPTPDAGAPPAAVDAASPPPSVDAATDAGPVVRPARTTLLTSADLSTAEVLAADEDGIYWVTGDNRLWMLPTGSETPRQLAADLNPTIGANTWASVLARGDALFWTASILAPGGQYFR